MSEKKPKKSSRKPQVGDVIDAGDGTLLLKVLPSDVAEFAIFQKQRVWLKAQVDSLQTKPKKLFGDIGKAVVTASFKVYGEDLEDFKDFVYTKRKRGFTEYTQAQGLHEAWRLLFATMTIERRPDSVRSVQYMRTANQMIGRAVPEVIEAEKKEERKLKADRKKAKKQS